MNRQESSWQYERVYHEGDEFFSRLEADLIAATSSIELETYIFSDDPLGRLMVGLLKDAARRGVAVRVMVDGVGSPSWALRFLPELLEAGVEAKVYHPLPWIFWSYSLIWRRGVNGMLAFFRKVNRRNHRKVCIIDRKRAWLGSMNVSALHLIAYTGEKAWRDTGACVEGAAIIHLVDAFERAWRRARGPGKGVQRGFFTLFRRDQKVPALVRLNNTHYRRKRYFLGLLERITGANRRIWVMTPYFVPRGALVRVLSDAAARGVDVRILVPRKTDVFFMHWVTAAFYASLLPFGVRIFEFLPRVLHAKMLLIDDWAALGSGNLNHRSVLHDLEVEVLLTQEASIREIERQFERDVAVSQEIRAQELRQLSLLSRIAGRLFRLFKYWL